MAIIDTSVTNAMLDSAIGDATDGLTIIKLVYADSTESDYLDVSWDTAASGEIDISSNIVFTIPANKSVTSMYLFHGTTDTPGDPGILYTFETIYEYGDAGGTFTISSIPITIG